MKLFVSTRSRLERVGVQPLQPLQESHSISTHLKRAIPICVMILATIFSSIFFLFKANTIAEYAFSFYISVTALADLLIFIYAVCTENAIFAFINDLNALIQKRMVNPQSKLIYVNRNEKIDKWSDIFYLLLVKITVPGILIISFIMSYYLYFTTDLGGDAFRLPFFFWMPFDWRTPFGYLIAFSFQAVYCTYALHLTASILVLLFGNCFIMITLADELKEELGTLNESNKAAEKLEVIVEDLEQEENAEQEQERKSDSTETTGKASKTDPQTTSMNKHEIVTKKCIGKFKRFVEFHVEVMHLGRDFSNCFELLLLLVCGWSLLAGCGSLLEIEMKMSQFMENPADLIQPLFLSFWSFAYIFLLCEFGERVANRFEELNEMIYQSDWYTLPFAERRMLPTVILAAQQPISIRILGSMSCKRATFKYVFNVGYSNFLVLREFIK